MTFTFHVWEPVLWCWAAFAAGYHLRGRLDVWRIERWLKELPPEKRGLVSQFLEEVVNAKKQRDRPRPN